MNNWGKKSSKPYQECGSCIHINERDGICKRLNNRHLVSDWGSTSIGFCNIWVRDEECLINNYKRQK